jgi:hypothetical protein
VSLRRVVHRMRVTPCMMWRRAHMSTTTSMSYSLMVCIRQHRSSSNSRGCKQVTFTLTNPSRLH